MQIIFRGMQPSGCNPTASMHTVSVQRGQEGGHICRERSGKLAPLLAVWMLKAYLLGMQGLAWEGVDSLLQGGVAWES